MKYIIGITTVNRYPKRNYLKTTLKSLYLSGVFDRSDVRVVVSDSGSQNGLLHVCDYTKEYYMFWDMLEILYSKEKISANANRAKLLKHCVHTGAEFVIYMQDDVVVRPDFLTHVNSFITKYPEAIMWAFYASYVEVLHCAERGEDKWIYPHEKYYGSVCHALRAQHAWGYACELKRADRREESCGGDILLARWLKKCFPTRKIYASCPCYVQHIGEDSILSESHGFRKNQSFDKYFGESLKIIEN